MNGQEAESLAQRYLAGNGLELVTRNYRTRLGEIDLIMKDNETIVFIEVRYRKTTTYGSSAESIDRRKQAKLVSCAQHYLQKQKMSFSMASRFDVIAISKETGQPRIEWIKNAFQVE